MDWKKMLATGYKNLIFVYVLSVTLSLFQNMEAFTNSTL